MQQAGLHGRHRDKNGEISRKHGNTLVRTLRRIYGPQFADGEPEMAKLSDGLQHVRRAVAPHPGARRRARARRGQDLPAGVIPRGDDGPGEIRRPERPSECGREIHRMRITAGALCALTLTLSSAGAQQAESGARATTPIPGIEGAAVAQSARASKLIGSKVYKGDTSIGQIEDILIQIDRGTVPAVILSVGGFLGIGDKLVAVPVTQIKIGSEARFVTDLTKEQLTKAPAFVFGKAN
jgi:sporulation protein YlmC with PRC-barrel domain